MDFLRFGYKSRMRFFKDSNQTTEVIWYRARPGAKVFPFPHIFGSRFWDADHAVAQVGPGEVSGSYEEWQNSVNHWGYTGQDFVGDPDWYLHGAPSSAAGANPTDGNGFCQNCFPGGGGGQQGCFSDGFSDGFEI